MWQEEQDRLWAKLTVALHDYQYGHAPAGIVEPYHWAWAEGAATLVIKIIENFYGDENEATSL